MLVIDESLLIYTFVLRNRVPPPSWEFGNYCLKEHFETLKKVEIFFSQGFLAILWPLGQECFAID